MPSSEAGHREDNSSSESLAFSCVKIYRKSDPDDTNTNGDYDNEVFWLFESEVELPTIRSLIDLVKPEIIKRHGSFPPHLENIEEPISFRATSSQLSSSYNNSRPRRQPRRLVEPAVFLRGSSTVPHDTRPSEAGRSIPALETPSIAEYLRGLSPELFNAIAEAGPHPNIATLLSLIKQQDKERQRLRTSRQYPRISPLASPFLTPQQNLLHKRLMTLQTCLRHHGTQSSSPNSSSNNLYTVPTRPTASVSHFRDRSAIVHRMGRATQHECGTATETNSTNWRPVGNQLVGKSPFSSLPSSLLYNYVFPRSSLYGELQSQLADTDDAAGYSHSVTLPPSSKESNRDNVLMNSEMVDRIGQSVATTMKSSLNDSFKTRTLQYEVDSLSPLSPVSLVKTNHLLGGQPSSILYGPNRSKKEARPTELSLINTHQFGEISKSRLPL